MRVAKCGPVHCRDGGPRSPVPDRLAQTSPNFLVVPLGDHRVGRHEFMMNDFSAVGDDYEYDYVLISSRQPYTHPRYDALF